MVATRLPNLQDSRCSAPLACLHGSHHVTFRRQLALHSLQAQAQRLQRPHRRLQPLLLAPTVGQEAQQLTALLLGFPIAGGSGMHR